ncbi:FAD-dependent oxidoreductase domain-containing protein 2 [Nematostella vectensis]|nr:FAD-dependent oxidoreductase domain-containing protein 2 [Nematostella vectensis]
MQALGSLRYFLFLLLCCVHVLHSKSNSNYHDYCVIGAGPAGLQMGFFLEKASRDYVIFERNGVAGSFYVELPRHRTLISINKRHTGKTNKEFNLRHDWNSLISDDESLLMKHYSKKFFPDADDYVKYLNDYATKLKLNVQYNTNIRNVSRKVMGKTTQFFIKDQNDTVYECRTLVVSTGIWVENLATQFDGVEYTESYSSISTNPDDFEGQSVLIIGRGNSAFETADRIMGATNLIHMMARSRVRLSWETHYVGDLRAINNGILDTYQLKSLDALLEAPVEEIIVIKRNGKLYVMQKEDLEQMSFDHLDDNSTLPDNFAMRDPYDRIIRCLGFKFDFSIFDNSSLPKPCMGKRSKKYPEVYPNYESVSVPGMFFAGTNTHSVDFRKSAGGFIHGFRYTTRALFHHLEWKFNKVIWPHITIPYLDLMNHIIKRINEASGIYQMFGVLGDVMVFRKDGKVDYFEEYPIKTLNAFKKITGYKPGPMVVLNMEYGPNFSGAGKDIFRPDRAHGEAREAHMSNFLHPVFYFYKKHPNKMNVEKDIRLPRPDRIHHIVEDFLTSWQAPLTHILPLRRFLETIHGQDLRQFFASSCFKLMMTHSTVPESCREHYAKGQSLPGTYVLLNTARERQLLSS